MQSDGRMEEIEPGILIQCGLKIYDEKTGLAVFAEQLPIEDLMI